MTHPTGGRRTLRSARGGLVGFAALCGLVTGACGDASKAGGSPSAAEPGTGGVAVITGAGGTPSAPSGTAGTSSSAGSPAGGAPSSPSNGGTSPGSAGAPAFQAGGAPAVTSSGGTSSTGASGMGGAPSGGGAGASGGAAGGPGTTPYKLSIDIPVVNPGEENTQCVQVKLPNTTPVDVVELHNTLSLGSHHFIVSALTASSATEMALTPCKPFRAALQGGPLAITQKKDDTIFTPAGVGYSLSATQLMSLELHYINTGTDMLDVHAETEIYPARDGSNLQESSVLLIGTTNFTIPANAAYSTGPRYIPMPSQLNGVNYFAITGHTHHLGTAVKVSSTASATATPISLYAPTPYDWDSPVLTQLDPAVQVPTGGGFTLQCDWQNTTNGSITWGESASTNEMCFFWAYYYPKTSVSNLILEGFGPVDPSVIQGLGI